MIFLKDTLINPAADRRVAISTRYSFPVTLTFCWDSGAWKKEWAAEGDRSRLFLPNAWAVSAFAAIKEPCFISGLGWRGLSFERVWNRGPFSVKRTLKCLHDRNRSAP